MEVILEEDVEELDELEALIRGESEPTKTSLIPKTISADMIFSIEPSIYGDDWTDIECKNGSMIVCNQPYAVFKTRWLIALDLHPQQTFEDLKNENGDIKIRVYNN